MLKTRKTSPCKRDYSRVVTWLLIAGLTLTGCTSDLARVRVDNVRRSMVTILHAAEHASLGGIRSRSRNERTFYGAYHPPGGKPNIDASQSRKRAHSVISVLNARRPYTIVVKYVLEERFGGAYTKTGEDERMAKVVKKRFLEYLASRPEKGDFVDDFRAF